MGKVNIKYQLGMVFFKCILLEWQPDPCIGTRGETAVQTPTRWVNSTGSNPIVGKKHELMNDL